MKTEPFDYLFSTLALCVLAGVSLLITDSTFHSLSPHYFGPYSILADALGFLLIYGLLSGVTTRLMLRIRPLVSGDYSMDHPQFRWWKLFSVIHEFGRGALVPFTLVFFRPMIAVLFGARIGKDIALGGCLVDPELITIGDRAIIGQGSVIAAHTITSGKLTLGPVVIGRGVTVGVNSVVMSGVHIGEGSVLVGGTVVPPDTMIPAFELWAGSPARKIKDLPKNM